MTEFILLTVSLSENTTVLVTFKKSARKKFVIEKNWLFYVQISITLEILFCFGFCLFRLFEWSSCLIELEKIFSMVLRLKFCATMLKFRKLPSFWLIWPFSFLMSFLLLWSMLSLSLILLIAQAHVLQYHEFRSRLLPSVFLVELKCFLQFLCSS